TGRLPSGLAQRLAHLGRHVLRDTFGARLEGVGGLEEEGGTLACGAPRPARKRRSRRLDCLARVVCVRCGVDARDDRGPPWIALLVGLAGLAVAPFAADPVAGGSVGERLGHRRLPSRRSVASTTSFRSLPIPGTATSTTWPGSSVKSSGGTSPVPVNRTLP